jgi:TonB-dependent SusC/RagA subfamily outer membrane receptor
MKKTFLIIALSIVLTPMAFAQSISKVDSLQTQSDTVRNYVNFNSPLFILDGVELSFDSINKIDQNDIAELQVLKDAASLASFGEKGKNGVILITTKTFKSSTELKIKGID